MAGVVRPCAVLMVAIIIAAACGSAATSTGRATIEPVAGGPTITLGVFPFVDPLQIDALYGPLATAIAEATGTPVRLQTSMTFEEFDRRLRSLEFDIAVVQPFELVEVVDLLGFRPLARADGQLHAIVVVASSDVRALSVLVGSSVGTPPADAAVSRLFDAALLGAEIAPGALDIQRFATHTACLSRMETGRVDACVTAPLPLANFERTRGQDFTVIAETESIDHIGWVARPGLDTPILEATQSFLLDLHSSPEGRFLLERIGFDRYVPVTGTDYQNVRRLAAELAQESP